MTRSSGLAKTILQGTVKGGRRQGRQRKRWEDNIREWTGLEFAKSQRAVKTREKWRKLVAKSSVVPQRPSRIDDEDDIYMRVRTRQKKTFFQPQRRQRGNEATKVLTFKQIVQQSLDVSTDPGPVS